MLRSIRQAHEMILKQDPETAISVYIIRVWCKEKKIRSLSVGNKILVDFEALKNYIDYGDSNTKREM